MYFSRTFHWWPCGARQIERGGYKIQWKLIKFCILSKILLFEGYLWASRRAPMPWRALILTEMKTLMNLEDFCTFNRSYISKIHFLMKKYLGVEIVELYIFTGRNCSVSWAVVWMLYELLFCWQHINILSWKLIWSRAVVIRFQSKLFSWVFEIWGRLRVQNAFKFIKLFVSVNISARQGIGARLEAYN